MISSKKITQKSQEKSPKKNRKMANNKTTETNAGEKANNKTTETNAGKELETTKRKVMAELHLMEAPSKRASVIERQVRLRMAAVAAEENDDSFTKEAVEKTVYLQKSRSEAYKLSPIDLSTIGVEEQDEVAIREKLK